MFKKIMATIATVMVVATLGVSAERNIYNEMDCINLSNETIQDYADAAGISLEEFKVMFGLPEDMPGDTNEAVALGYVPLKNLAETSNMALQEVIAFYKDGYIGPEEVTGDTLTKDVDNFVTVGKFIGSTPIEEFREIFGFGTDVTESTPFKGLENIVKRRILAESHTLSYDDGSSILVMVKGKYIDFDVAPVIENERVLVPMRNIFAALGADVIWQGDVNTVIATRGEDVIALQPGQNFLFKNNEKIEIPTAAIAKDNRILVPIRAVAESLDTEVFYNGNTNTVVIH